MLRLLGLGLALAGLAVTFIDSRKSKKIEPKNPVDNVKPPLPVKAKLENKQELKQEPEPEPEPEKTDV